MEAEVEVKEEGAIGVSRSVQVPEIEQQIRASKDEVMWTVHL